MSSGLLIRGGLVTLAASEENSLVALGGGDKMLLSDGAAHNLLPPVVRGETCNYTVR